MVFPRSEEKCVVYKICEVIFVHRCTWIEVQATVVVNGARDIVNKQTDPQIGSLKCDKHLFVQVYCSGCLQHCRTRNPWKTYTPQFSFTWVIVEDWRWKRSRAPKSPRLHIKINYSQPRTTLNSPIFQPMPNLWFEISVGQINLFGCEIDRGDYFVICHFCPWTDTQDVCRTSSWRPQVLGSHNSTFN